MVFKLIHIHRNVRRITLREGNELHLTNKLNIYLENNRIT